ncbi:hypothetical protein TRAPUB_4892 [Trametes pubescens]|uniref:Uncharacterized protein n=1 Tax=Trametes pubescens TaxID=154538 RepID=A0A1M2VA57_TRAPU|nr:hypothetical protein TRAPUB_4892 [Trametes pubescens]
MKQFTVLSSSHLAFGINASYIVGRTVYVDSCNIVNFGAKKASSDDLQLMPAGGAETRDVVEAD